jgi:hypothetical protein
MLSTLKTSPIKSNVNIVVLGSWSENILKYFLRNNQITAEDGAEILWSHAANHKSQMNEALKSKWLLQKLSSYFISFYFIFKTLCNPG